MTYMPQNKFIYAPDGWDDCWQAAKAASGTTAANILQIGDSIGQGFATTNNITKSYFSLLRTKLITDYSLGADFYGPQWSLYSSPSLLGTAPFVFGAGAKSSSPGGFGFFAFNSAVYSTPLVTFTSPAACIAVDVHYQDYAAGTFDILIDGVFNQTITNTTVNGTNSAIDKKVSITGLSNAVHTVTLQNPSASTTCIIVGITTYTTSSTGIRFANISVQGYATTHWMTIPNATGVQMRPALFQGATPQNQGITQTVPNNTGFGFPTQPHLFIYELGVNDMQLATAPEEYAVNTSLFINAVRRGQPNASIVLVAPSVPSGVNSDVTTPFTTSVLWEEYLIKMHDIARTYNCAFVNIHAKWGETGVNSGFQTAGDSHPTDAGHTDMANLIGKII